jgi:hypothetical protein
MIGEASRHRWCARLPFARGSRWSELAEAVMGPADVVGGPDQPHASGEGGLGPGDGTTPSGQRREVGPEGGVEPLDVRGVDDGAGRGRRQDRLDAGLGPLQDPARDPDDMPLGCMFDDPGELEPVGRTRRGRPRRPV